MVCKQAALDAAMKGRNGQYRSLVFLVMSYHGYSVISNWTGRWVFFCMTIARGATPLP
jgi:hypothetical protein